MTSRHRILTQIGGQVSRVAGELVWEASREIDLSRRLIGGHVVFDK